MAKTNHRHPGGRPPKLDKAEWGQVTCVLRHDTIDRLRAGANSKHFGAFLQSHLDRYPPPTRKHFLALTQHAPAWTRVKRQKVAAIVIDDPLFHTQSERKWASETKRDQRRQAREAKRRAKLSPADRKWEDQLLASIKAHA